MICNISVSTHAPAGARRIYACLTYLRKRLLIVIPRCDAESSVSKLPHVRRAKPLGPASIGENAADRVRPVSSGARNGQMKSKMSATLTSRSVGARGDEMAVSCIELSKNQGYKAAGERRGFPAARCWERSLRRSPYLFALSSALSSLINSMFCLIMSSLRAFCSSSSSSFACIAMT